MAKVNERELYTGTNIPLYKVVPNTENAYVPVADLNSGTNGTGVTPEWSASYNPNNPHYTGKIGTAPASSGAGNGGSGEGGSGGGNGGNGGSGKGSAAEETPQETAQSAPQELSGVWLGYDPATDAAYQSALAALQDAEGNAPQYTPSYDAQLNDIYNRIVNRDKFSYDINGDALYQQMKDQYIRQGQLAMMDAMGQQAALNGGYGSSYGQAVGQQAYNNYLQQLNNNIPEYYDRAFQQYQNEGNALLQQYELTGDLADRERQEFSEAYDRWLNERSYAQGAEQQAYNRGLDAWQMRYGIENDLYGRQQDEYSRMVNLITNYGYKPTDEEIAAAGLTREQVEAMMPKKKSGGGSPKVTGSDTKADYITARNLALEAGDEKTAAQIEYDYINSDAYNGSDLGSMTATEYEYWKRISGFRDDDDITGKRR